jgi:hypothetical protein
VKFILAAAGALLVAGLAVDLASAEDVSAVGEAFCKARLADDELATRALLSKSLVTAIEEAEARREIVAKAAPDEKPPLGDGIPYQAFPDAVGACEVGRTVEAGGRVELEIAYRFPDAPNAGWTDRIKLLTEDDRLAIDDVLYADVANSDPGYGLRRVLFDAFDR